MTASEAMYKQMLACEDPDKLRRFSPPGMKIAMKTGDLDAAKGAAGIIECGRGAVAVCVLTSENEDRRWITDNAGNRPVAEVALRGDSALHAAEGSLRNGRSSMTLIQD